MILSKSYSRALTRKSSTRIGTIDCPVAYSGDFYSLSGGAKREHASYIELYHEDGLNSQLASAVALGHDQLTH
jgi:hypothetical protein